jgi:MazG family protein
MLFQVVYHARLAEEKGAFSFPDVISGVCQKLRDRHPQIFAAGQGHQPDQASEGDVWELRKITARKKREASQLLADVPPALPALSTASKYGKRAAAVGFDWKDSRQVVSKVREELAELEEAIQQGSSTHIEEEIGDLLFTVANLSRHLDTDAETALRLGNAKFARRFHAMETQIDASNRPWPEWEDEELEQAWSEIKSRESAAN